MIRKLYSCMVLTFFIFNHLKHVRHSQFEKNLRVALLGNPSNNISCPWPRKDFDLEFPVGFPQNLTFGKFRDQTGFPLLSQDFWANIVDNRRTFFLRPNDDGFPSTDLLRRWIQSRPHQITLIVNNNQDKSWPENIESEDYELILEEENIHRVFAGNARNLSRSKKLRPIPIGLKWQWRSTLLFGEEKRISWEKYSQVSSTAIESEKLFSLSNRTNTVWIRPMLNSNKRTRNYERNTDALQTARVDIQGILKESAPLSLVTKKMDYFTGLKKNRFVISPAGNGLDTHGTWEALLAGCIPIVPKSPLDPLFEDLPVWLVESWSEVTDESVALMSDRFQKRGKFNWAKLFVPWWREKIHEGLCRVDML